MSGQFGGHFSQVCFVGKEVGSITYFNTVFSFFVKKFINA